MRIAAARLIAYRLPLLQPWRSGQGRCHVREGWWIRLEAADGTAGHGDAAPWPAAGTEPPARSLAWLAPYLRGLEGATVRGAVEALPEDAPPAARCGVETALLDLLSRDSAIGLDRWLNPEAGASVAVNAAAGTLTDLTPDGLLRIAKAGYPVAKLKVGLAPWREELTLLHRLAMDLPPGLRLRLDANRAWSPREADAMLDALADLPVEAVEEPLADPDPAGLDRLQRRCPFPIAVDESLRNIDPDALLASPPCRRLVLKPTREGGLRRTVELARRAQAAGMEAVITTLLESAIGGHASAHVARAVDDPGRPLAHGLDTGRWLRRDLAAPPTAIHGHLTAPATPGLGVDPQLETEA